MRLLFSALIILLAFYGWYFHANRFLSVLNRTINMGTLEGVKKCVEFKRTDLLEESALRDFCAKELQVESYDFRVSGEGNPQISFGNRVFAATLKNSSDSWIATELVLRILVDQKGLKDVVELKKKVWIEPNSESFETFELDTISDVTWNKWQECRTSKTPFGCETWVVFEQYGVKIE